MMTNNDDNYNGGSEMGVRVRTTLVKDTCVWCRDELVVTEWVYDEALGRRVPVGHWEEDDDLGERFRDEHLSAIQIIERCGRICRELSQQGVRWLAHVNIGDLLLECDDWDEEELSIERS